MERREPYSDFRVSKATPEATTPETPAEETGKEPAETTLPPSGRVRLNPESPRGRKGRSRRSRSQRSARSQRAERADPPESAEALVPAEPVEDADRVEYLARLEPDEREEPPKRALRTPRSKRSQPRSTRAVRGRHVLIASGIALAVAGWLFLAYGPALPEAPTNQAGRATPPPAGSKSPQPEKPPARAKPLSQAEAKKIWEDHRKTIDAATQDGEVKALDRAMDGIALQMTRTRRQIDQKADAASNFPDGSGKPRFVIPKAGGWFVVFTKDNLATVLAESPKGWRAVAAVSTKGQRLPRIAKDQDGHAVPVGEDDRLGSLTPRSAADGLAGYFSVPAGDSAGLRLRPGPLTTETRKRIDEWRNQWAKSPEAWDARRIEVVQRAPFYTVKTADGGALTFFATVQTNTYEARRPGRGARLNLADAKALSSGKYFDKNITTTNGRMYLAHIDKGVVNVLSIRDQLLTVRGE